MPAVTTERILILDKDREILCDWKASISVDSDGWFYCYPPRDIAEVVTADISKMFKVEYLHRRKKSGCFGSLKMDDLINFLKHITEVLHTPVVEESLIIAYNIESRISFAEDAAGNIYPNASFWGAGGERAEWVDTKKWSNGMHDEHGPFSKGPGGFSMIVGARALTKVSHTYGDRVVTKYERFYGPGCSHFEQDHPAGRLNSWGCPLPDPDNCRQMPYTDAAALFFSNLMMGMAKLSKQIQSIASDEQLLIEVANNGGRLLSFDGKGTP